MKILEGAVVTLAVTTALFMVLWGSAVRQWQTSQREVDRLTREVRTYRDAVGTLNLLLTEAQNGEPRVVAGEALRVDIIAGAPGANADDDAILVDVGTPLCMPGGVDPKGLSRMIQVDEQGRVLCAPPKEGIAEMYRDKGPRQSPVFPRDSQFIGTERER